MQILPSVGFILVVVLVFRQHIFVCVGRGGGVCLLVFCFENELPWAQPCWLISYE